jgi:integrase
MPSLPKYRQHRSGQARVTLPGTPRRRTVYLGRFGSEESKQAYQRVIQEWLLERTVPPPVAECSAVERSVAELIEAYQAHAEEYYRHSASERKRIKLAMRPLRELYGTLPAAKFGPLALRAVRQRMIVSEDLARITTNQRIGVIKRLFKWGVENELVPASLSHALQAVDGLRRGKSRARETEPVQPVADELVDRTLPFLRRHVRAMVEVQRLTGARSGEIIRMRIKDIDRSGQVWVFRPSTHKTAHRGHAREIYLGPKAQGLLASFLKADPDAYVFSPREAVAEFHLERRRKRKTEVQPSQGCGRKLHPKWVPGAGYKVGSYRNAILRACQRAGVPDWHPHQLRHSAGTYLRKQFGVEVARIILGHRSLQATEIYSELNREQAIEVMGQVG